MANVFELKKNVVTYTQDKTAWRWSEHSLKSICKSEAYGSLKVRLGKHTVPITKAVNYYQVLQDRKDWKTAKTVKEIIWSALDNKSRERIKAHYDIPEVRIASIYRENPEDDAIVAFYALNEENYYNGNLESIVPGTYKEFIDRTVLVEKPNGKRCKRILENGTIRTIRYDECHCKGIYEEHLIIGGNSTVTFSNYMETSPYFKWLPKAIAIAEQFDIKPNWQPCVHSGKRGIGLTAHDARELQAVANWYSGLADTDQEDIKCDWSDKIWLHHENGIDSVQISKREYELNKDKWSDWKQTETRDFRCDLYEDEEELN